jgi:hypothetical protein
MDGFPSLIFFTRFFFMEESSKTLGSIVGSSIGGSLVEVRHILRPTFIYWRFIGGKLDIYLGPLSSIGGSLVEVRHILRPTFIYWRFIGGSYTYT